MQTFRGGSAALVKGGFSRRGWPFHLTWLPGNPSTLTSFSWRRRFLAKLGSLCHHAIMKCHKTSLIHPNCSSNMFKCGFWTVAVLPLLLPFCEWLEVLFRINAYSLHSFTVSWNLWNLQAMKRWRHRPVVHQAYKAPPNGKMQRWLGDSEGVFGIPGLVTRPSKWTQDAMKNCRNMKSERNGHDNHLVSNKISKMR